MSTWVWSDLHLNHTNIIGYEKRPFKDSEEMTEHFVKVWKNTVSKRDFIINLGDVFLYGSKEWLSDLVRDCPGRKYLILGNHDRRNIQFWHDVGFEFVSPYPIIFRNKYILSHAPIEVPRQCLNVYGHVHGNKYIHPAEGSFCVSVEQINYKPFLLEKN